MRKQMAPILSIIALSVLSVLFLVSPQILSQVPKQSVQSKMSPSEQMNQMLKSKPLIPQGIDGGLWRVDHAFVSTLMLKNIVTIAPIKVTPILYMADGTEYDLPAVKLDAAGVAVISINNALNDVPSKIQSHVSTYGSAGIRYQWLWSGAVTAEVRNGDDVRSLVYASHPHADTIKVNDPAATESQQTLEGMWWKQDEYTKCFVTLTNASKNDINAVLQVFDSEANNTVEKNLQIHPHNTQFVDVTSLWAQLPYTEAQGGIRVSYTAPSDALIVEGGLEDDVKGYSHPLRFGSVIPGPTTSPLLGGSPSSAGTKSSLSAVPQAVTQSAEPSQMINFDSAGIMVGTQDPNMQFPQGTLFTPYMVLRNMTESPMQVHLTANYSNGPTPTNIGLGRIVLPAKYIQQVDVKSLLTAVGLGTFNGYLNLQTSFFGRGGDLLEETGSVDQTKSYVFETPPTMEGPARGRIFSYWNSSGDTDSMFSFWNYSGKDEELVLTLYHQAGQYKLPIHLAANASVTIGIAALIKSGKQDADGNTLPMNTAQGSAKLSGPNMEDIDVAIHGSVFNVRTGTCCCICPVCCYVTSTFICPSPLNENVGDTIDLQPMVVFVDATCCDISLDMNWNTPGPHPDVATVDGDGQLTGTGPGSTQFTGQSGSTYPTQTAPACEVFLSPAFCGPYIAASFLGGVTVSGPAPDHLIITHDGVSNISACPTTKVRTVLYQIVDANNNFLVAPFQVKEQFDSTGSNSCGNGDLHLTTNCTGLSLSAIGAIADTLTVACNSSSDPACGFTLTNQRWLWCPASGGPSVVLGKIGDLIVHNNSISVGGNLIGRPTGTCVFPDGTYSLCQ